MTEESQSEESFLQKAKVPAAVAGGGLCGVVVTAVAIQVLSPVVVVAGGVAAGAGTYHWLTNRPDNPEEE